ncbi:MAG TPA: M67 family metallopeptidase [Coriobacteriia bacterium]
MPASLLDTLVAYALDGLPNEVCGILGGKDGRVERVLPLTNAAASPEFYEVIPEEQLAAYADLYDAGLVALGVYHSHPASPARPSATDVALAHDPAAVYAIVSLQDRSNPEVRAYRVRDGEVTEIAITKTEE